MADLIAAWNEKTGKKLPNPVPEDWIDHPVLGVGITDTPPTTAPSATAGGFPLPEAEEPTEAGKTARSRKKD